MRSFYRFLIRRGLLETSPIKISPCQSRRSACRVSSPRSRFWRFWAPLVELKRIKRTKSLEREKGKRAAPRKEAAILAEGPCLLAGPCHFKFLLLRLRQRLAPQSGGYLPVGNRCGYWGKGRRANSADWRAGTRRSATIGELERRPEADEPVFRADAQAEPPTPRLIQYNSRDTLHRAGPLAAKLRHSCGCGADFGRQSCWATNIS